jgi:hypothetical protein
MPFMIAEETLDAYTARDAAEAMAFSGLEAPVFLTSDGCSVLAKTILLVRTGRDMTESWVDEAESDFDLSFGAVDAEGGAFIGRLEIVFVIRWRSCAAESDTNPILTKKAQTNRYEIPFKLFKTYTPKTICGRNVFAGKGETVHL